MNSAEMARFLRASMETYIAERIQAGEDPATAAKVAQDQTAAMFPNGAPAPGHHLYRLEHDEQVVGALWLGPAPADTNDSYWIWEITVDEAHRGRGIGAAAMLLAEDEARMAGATSLGLNVFGHNDGARRLYERLGYRVVAVRMNKAL